MKLASKGDYPSYDVCCRVDWTGEVKRASGDEGSGLAVSESPSEESGVGLRMREEMTLRV